MSESKKIIYIEYTDRMEKAVKSLLLQLQQHLANLDERGVIVVKENYADDYFNFVMEEIKKHNGKTFVAMEDLCGAYVAVGMVVCKIFQGGGENDITTSCPQIGFISDLVVSEDYRGLGIGTQLITKAENYFMENKCDYTQLEVFAPNKDAFRLYEKLGYEVNCYYLSKKVKEKDIIKHIVSVSDNLKEKASEILLNYKKLWLLLLSADKYESIDWGINIVKALNESYKNYSGFEKYFISEWFMFDLISAFGEEKWFSRFISADSIPYECKPQCLYNSTMIGEYIYGGIPIEFPLADIAKRNCLTEEECQKIYNEFWQKTIEVLNSGGK